VGLDGDDTLWHNETRFHLTQTALRDLLRRHVPDADVYSHLNDVELRSFSL
jgi:putative hydrolase of the HAD superfamily